MQGRPGEGSARTRTNPAGPRHTVAASRVPSGRRKRRSERCGLHHSRQKSCIARSGRKDFIQSAVSMRLIIKAVRFGGRCWVGRASALCQLEDTVGICSEFRGDPGLEGQPRPGFSRLSPPSLKGVAKPPLIPLSRSDFLRERPRESRWSKIPGARPKDLLRITWGEPQGWMPASASAGKILRSPPEFPEVRHSAAAPSGSQLRSKRLGNPLSGARGAQCTMRAPGPPVKSVKVHRANCATGRTVCRVVPRKVRVREYLPPWTKPAKPLPSYPPRTKNRPRGRIPRAVVIRPSASGDQRLSTTG
jgi:hypothetical protein